VVNESSFLLLTAAWLRAEYAQNQKGRRTSMKGRPLVQIMSIAGDKVGRILETIERCEEELQIDATACWTPTSPQYMKTLEYIRKRKFILTLDQLEKLVVQRLFELQKCHLESTGEASLLYFLIKRIHLFQIRL
jgi:hypothetical protein